MRKLSNDEQDWLRVHRDDGNFIDNFLIPLWDQLFGGDKIRKRHERGLKNRSGGVSEIKQNDSDLSFIWPRVRNDFRDDWESMKNILATVWSNLKKVLSRLR